MAGLRKSDWRKRVIGRLVRRSTVMPVTRIAESLQLGDPKRAAMLVQSDPNPSWGKDWKLGRTLMRELESNEKR